MRNTKPRENPVFCRGFASVETRRRPTSPRFGVRGGRANAQRAVRCDAVARRFSFTRPRKTRAADPQPGRRTRSSASSHRHAAMRATAPAIRPACRRCWLRIAAKAAQPLARRAGQRAGADPDRARQLDREGRRHRRRRRRLSRQAVSHGRAAGAHPRADPACARHARTGAAMRPRADESARGQRHRGPTSWRAWPLRWTGAPTAS